MTDDTPAVPAPHTFDPVLREVTADQLVNAREAAEILGVTSATITRRVQAGILVPLRSDPLIFHRADLEQMRRAGA